MVKEKFIKRPGNITGAPAEVIPLNDEETLKVLETKSKNDLRINKLKQKREARAAEAEAKKKAKNQVILLIYYILMMCRSKVKYLMDTCRDEMPLMFGLRIKVKYKLIFKKLHKKQNKELNKNDHDVTSWL